jgi:CheY-like chemotaxis protein
VTEQLELLAGSSDTALGGAVAELSELTGEIGVAIARIRETIDKLTNVGGPDAPLVRLEVGLLAREAMIVGRPHLERQGVCSKERFTSDCFTLGRKDALEQVILNLVFNAADACAGRLATSDLAARRGGRSARRAHRRGQRTRRSRRVDREHLSAVLHDQGRGHSAGLGLKICSDVVSEHGGHIEVHQRPGGGAAFHVLLPRVDAEGLPALNETPSPALAEPSGQRRVLVIDDDPVIARSLRRALKPHDVRTAGSASEAEIALLEPQYVPDLVVCDVYLPGANGNVLHERILQKRPDIADRFVFVTGGGLGRAEADYPERLRSPRRS